MTTTTAYPTIASACIALIAEWRAATPAPILGGHARWDSSAEYTEAIEPYGPIDGIPTLSDDGTMYVFPDWSGIDLDPETREWDEMLPAEVADVVLEARTWEITAHLETRPAPEAVSLSPDDSYPGLVVLVARPYPRLVMWWPTEARMPETLIPSMGDTARAEGVYDELPLTEDEVRDALYAYPGEVTSEMLTELGLDAR